jgi:hypothetical protein
MQLIRLMGKTSHAGDTLEQLNKPNLHHVLSKIVEFLEEKEFVDFLIPWVSACMDHNIELTSTHRSSLIDCIKGLLSSQSVSNADHRSALERTLKALKKC